jgi:hypothetical protein
MPTVLRLSPLRATVAALYAVAMLLLGVAHAPVAGAAAKPTVDLAAFLLPDGSVPDLCVVDAGGAGDHAPLHVAVTLCDACLLTGAPGLPPPVSITAAPVSVGSAAVMVDRGPAPVARFEVPGTSRAPPILVVVPA